jgi:DNA-binding HxlR family transcriptional regulator
MLSRIIKELKRAGGAIDLNELSRRLGVQRSALDGMIETLVRKGRLREVEVGEIPPMCASCAKRSGCTLVSIGKAYEVVNTRVSTT